MEAQRAHGHLSLQGFQKLNLSEGQPKTLYILLRGRLRTEGTGRNGQSAAGVHSYNVPYKVDTASERDCLKC